MPLRAWIVQNAGCHSRYVVRKYVTIPVGLQNINSSFTFTREGCPIPPGGTLHRTYTMTPRLGAAVADRHGVALGGRLRDEDTELASTTLYKKSLILLFDFFSFLVLIPFYMCLKKRKQDG